MGSGSRSLQQANDRTGNTQRGGNQHVQQSRKPARLGATEQTAGTGGSSGEAGLAACTPSPEGQRPALGPGEAASRRPRGPRLEGPLTPPSLPGTSPGTSPGVSGPDSGCRDPTGAPGSPPAVGVMALGRVSQ